MSDEAEFGHGLDQLIQDFGAVDALGVRNSARSLATASWASAIGWTRTISLDGLDFVGIGGGVDRFFQAATVR